MKFPPVEKIGIILFTNPNELEIKISTRNETIIPSMSFEHQSRLYNESFDGVIN